MKTTYNDKEQVTAYSWKIPGLPASIICAATFAAGLYVAYEFHGRAR